MSTGVKIHVVDIMNHLEDHCLVEVKDNYRTHDPWIFIKPRPLLNLFKQIHYWAASLPGRQAACQLVTQRVHFHLQQRRWTGQQGGAEAGSGSSGRDGVSGEFLA